MRAVILAGGRGTRLAPYTTVIPKPLLPVGETPILEIVLRQLTAAGFDHITLTLGWMAAYFRTFIDQRSDLRRLARIDFVEELQPTGTAGSLASVEGLEDGPFLVMNGDLLTTLDYAALVDFHQRRQAELTIALHQKPVPIDLGVVETASDGERVTGYVEKPTLHYTVSMGVYIYSPSVLDEIAPGQYLDFPTLALRLINQGRAVFGYPNDAYWLDLGRPEDLELAQQIFAERSDEFLPSATEASD